jgi:hypothetical protein
VWNVLHMDHSNPRFSPGAGRSRAARLPLSPRMTRALADGASTVGYVSEATLDFAVCLSAVQRGYTFDEVWRAYWHDPRIRSGADRLDAMTRRGGPGAALKYLLKRYEAARRRHAASGIRGRYDVSVVWSALLHRLPGVPFPGKGGPAELALLMTVMAAGFEQEDLAPRVSRLDFMVTTGLSHEGVERGLKRLAKRGLAECDGRPAVGMKARWRLSESAINDRAAEIEGCFIGGVGGLTSNPRLLPAHDVWIAGGLGLGCWHFLLLLEFAGPLETNDVLRITGTSRETGRGRLVRLAAAGLLRKTGDMWAAGGADLDDVASRLGMSGRLEQHRRAAMARVEQGAEWLQQRNEAVEKVLDFRDWRQKVYAATAPVATLRGWRFTVVDDSSEAYERCREAATVS